MRSGCASVLSTYRSKGSSSLGLNSRYAYFSVSARRSAPSSQARSALLAVAGIQGVMVTLCWAFAMLTEGCIRVYLCTVSPLRADQESVTRDLLLGIASAMSRLIQWALPECSEANAGTAI